MVQLKTYVFFRGPHLSEEIVLTIFLILFYWYIAHRIYLNYKDEIKTTPQFLFLITKIITTQIVIYILGTYLSN